MLVKQSFIIKSVLPRKVNDLRFMFPSQLSSISKMLLLCQSDCSHAVRCEDAAIFLESLLGDPHLVERLQRGDRRRTAPAGDVPIGRRHQGYLHILRE